MKQSLKNNWKGLLLPMILCMGLGFYFSACEQEDPMNNDDSSKNYWDRSDAFRAGLRGKVKSVQIGDEKIEYNTDGKMTSVRVENVDNSFLNASDYSYDGEGRLVMVKSSYITSYYSSYDTITYKYGSHGKYVPASSFHFNEGGLMKNLIRVESRGDQYDAYASDLVFDGNKMNMIMFDIDDSESEPDTITFTYNGLYPSATRSEYYYDDGGSWGEFMEATYQENGMFDTYAEGFFGTGASAYEDRREFVYRKGGTFMLMDVYNQVRTETIGDGYTEKTTYTYNEKEDIVSSVSTFGYNSEYSDYVYDDQNNWVSRTLKTWSSYDTTQVYLESRIITYYE